MAVSTGGGEDEVMSTINITPFTDVLLVLLIIFIILASVTKEPKLPEAYNKDKVQPSQIVVIIDENDHVQIGSNQVAVRRREGGLCAASGRHRPQVQERHHQGRSEGHLRSHPSGDGRREDRLISPISVWLTTSRARPRERPRSPWQRAALRTLRRANGFAALSAWRS